MMDSTGSESPVLKEAWSSCKSYIIVNEFQNFNRMLFEKYIEKFKNNVK